MGKNEQIAVSRMTTLGWAVLNGKAQRSVTLGKDIQLGMEEVLVQL